MRTFVSAIALTETGRYQCSIIVYQVHELQDCQHVYMYVYIHVHVYIKPKLAQ